ncbi:MAG TPA: LUD domain-containing protein [Firmicutes bacterium]|nr:LUD domain-containing protein [Bacillota bacterium]
MGFKEPLETKIRMGLQDVQSTKGRNIALDVICPKHIAKVKQYPGLSRRLREIKAYSIANLDTLLPQAISSLQAAGCKVFYAKTGKEAVDYILSVVKGGTVVKSKTNAGKEVGLVEALEAKGVRVVETDLGDRIVQLADVLPSHSLVPALHVPREKISEIFTREYGYEVTTELDDLIAAARKGTLQEILKADYGLSGANAIAADSGTIFLIENEGNIRAVTNIPRVHIVIAGIEKIVPTPLDALTVVQAASVYGLGQDLGTYVSCISGPSRTADIEYRLVLGMHGPEEVHVVLIDNGRTEAIREGFQELLYCTNCGSCLNFCPVYGAIGENYGYKYLGGRGVAFTSFHASLEKAQKEGLSFCTTCESCRVACPAQINAPEMVKRLRAKAQKENVALETYAEAKRVIDAYGNPYGEKREPWGYEKEQAENVVFMGCVSAFREREAAMAGLELLQKLGVDFSTIDEKCCGGVYEDIGYAANPEFVQSNLDQIRAKGAKRLIVFCPRCTRFFKANKAFVGLEVVNILEFLSTIEIPVHIKDLVTWHDPCHLGRSLGIYDQPRGIIRKANGELVEPLRAYEYGRCCGAGSVVRGIYPRMSLNMARTRVDELAKLGARVILTECPACLHNLKNAKTSKHNVRVYNLTEYLNRLMAGGNGEE